MFVNVLKICMGVVGAGAIGGVRSGPCKRGIDDFIIECPICLETVTGTVQTVCGHKFCKPCIATSLKTKDNCPICRRHAPLVAAIQRKYVPDPILCRLQQQEKQMDDVHPDSVDVKAQWRRQLQQATWRAKSMRRWRWSNRRRTWVLFKDMLSISIDYANLNSSIRRRHYRNRTKQTTKTLQNIQLNEKSKTVHMQNHSLSFNFTVVMICKSNSYRPYCLSSCCH